MSSLASAGSVLDDSSVPLNLVPYTIAAFGTLLVYDYLCTLADEITLVWSQPFHIGTILFLLNRYPPFIDTFLSLYLLTTVQTPETCKRVFSTVTWLIVVGVFVAESILMLRTYAIYERKRWVLILLCCVLTGVVVPGFVVVKLELDSLSYGYPVSGPYNGCMFTKPTSAIIFVAYVLVVFSETLIGCLTLYKAVQHLRRSQAPLVVNLYRNGLMFYAYVLIISLANVIVPITAQNDAYDNWLATPQRVLHSVFCNRILLSILQSRADLNYPGSSASTTSNSRFSFRGASQGWRSTVYRFTSLLPASGSESAETGESSGGIVFATLRTDDEERGREEREEEGGEGNARLDDGVRAEDIPLQDLSYSGKGKRRAGGEDGMVYDRDEHG